MGLPVKRRKQYISHKKRWDKNTILVEKDLVKNYALKNKKEIRRLELLVKKYKTIAKQLNRLQNPSESPQGVAFLNKLKEMGIIDVNTTSIDNVLDITVVDFLERRLSNIVYKLKLAKTPEQARQFVVHKHVRIGDKVINSPGYLVTLSEVEQINFRETSALFNEDHPERQLESVKEIIEEVELVEEKTMETVEASLKEEVTQEQEQVETTQEKEEDKQ
ncbi:MAG: 30S ribosomal protein S4 [Nanoarchaeota archaeon]|nr:30S ribosomal protein S4 [Nanoarchaeota archaeon]